MHSHIERCNLPTSTRGLALHTGMRRGELLGLKWADKLADDIDKLADWPDNADLRYAVGWLEYAYKEQDTTLWWEALADLLTAFSGSLEPLGFMGACVPTQWICVGRSSKEDAEIIED